jgi:hypothetical protein
MRGRGLYSSVMRSVSSFAPLIALVAMCHCSNEDSLVLPSQHKDAGTDSGAGDSSCMSTICVVSAECNNVVNDGSNVTPEFVGGTAPAPVGGTLGDGKWTLTAYTVYSGDGGIIGTPEWVRSSVRITGDKFDIVSAYRSESFDHKDEYESDTFVTQGLTLTLTGVCPGPVIGAKGSAPYSASATEFKLYSVAFVGITVEETFTKR